MESETSELGVEGAGEPAGESLNSLSPHRFMQDPTMDLDDESTLISSAASSSLICLCSPTWKFPEPLFWGFLMETPSHRRADY